MIGEITPLVQAAGRRTWLAAALAHAFGATASGAVLGLALGALGLALRVEQASSSIGLVTGVLLLACAVRDAGLIRLGLPSLQRQTPRWFRKEFSPVSYGFLWGADLGQGWTTRILFTGYYGLLLWAVLYAGPVAGSVVLGAYGLGRALPVLVAGTFGGRQPLGQLNAWPLFRQPLLQQLNAFCLAFGAGFFVAGVS